MPQADSPIAMIGQTLGHYRVLEEIGSGGMGEVYRACDDRLGREVALKVLKPSLANDRDRLRRFEQEARAAAALNHPNIVAVYDIGMHNGAPYIVSELLQGRLCGNGSSMALSRCARRLIAVSRSRRVWWPPTRSASCTAI